MKNLIVRAVSQAREIKNWAMAHKLIAGVVLAATIGVSYGIYSAATAGTAEAKYVLATVERGTIVSSISGSGQVAVSRSIDVKAKASGDVTYVAVNDGQEVFAGQLLLIIDPIDAERGVRNAETDLAKAKIELQKLKGGETSAGLFRGAESKAVDDLESAYSDALAELASIFFEFPGVISGVEEVVLSDSLEGSNIFNASYYANSIHGLNKAALDYKDKAISNLETAKDSYEASAAEYKKISLSSDRATLDKMLQSTHSSSKLLAVAIKDAADLIQLYRDELKEENITPNALSGTHLSSLAIYAAKISSYLTKLTNLMDSVQDQKESMFNANISVADQEIDVRKAEDALTDAKTELANHYVRAPFAGVVSKVNVKKYDTASGAVATLLTKERVAQLSLNEVDAVKVRSGQKAELTFDAITNFTLTGEVIDVDVAGTVSQGVVTYSVKISFDSDDARVKPGMSVSADIITDSKAGVLIIPASAVKTIGRNSVVSILTERVPKNMANLQGIILPNPPVPQKVETGVSNDVSVEIISGLEEGDQIVIRTITGAAAKAPAAQNNNLFQVGQGGRTGATGGVRTGGGGSGGAIISR